MLLPNQIVSRCKPIVIVACSFIGVIASMSKLSLAQSKPIVDNSGLELWYNNPASRWTQALPLGNGRLGAMVFGGVEHEHISLNDNTLYSGGPGSRDVPIDITTGFAHVVKLLHQGRYAEADAYVTRHWLGRGQNSYQPLGDLHLAFDSIAPTTHYRRSLNLADAEATTNYEQGGVNFTREYFASFPSQAIVLRLTASQPGAISFVATLDSPHPTAKTTATTNGLLTMTGRVPYLVVRRELNWIEQHHDQWKYPELFYPDGKRRPNIPLYHCEEEANGAETKSSIARACPVIYGKRGTRFETQVQIRATGGTITAKDGALHVRGANKVMLVISSGSSFNGFNKSLSRDGADPSVQAAGVQARLAKRSYDSLLAEHVKDYRSLFDRVSLNLGAPSAEAALPTDQRIAHYADGHDPSLAALYFQFGRYLMIAGSRPGSQPLNLQGIWNNMIVPPWASAYTTNINLEMNYWPAEVTNLSECDQPLMRMIAELAINGRRTARKMYHRPGWVLHHNTDIWRGTQPVDFVARTAYWPMGSGWLATQLWEHFQFTGDETFLKNTGYPLMKGAATFYLAWLVDNGHGHLVTPVGTSPENDFSHRDPDGKTKVASVSQWPTMDMAIIRELFTDCVAASKRLKTDESFRQKLEKSLAKLLPYQISHTGAIQEWQHDFKEVDPHHRHISQLFGLYPGDQITQLGTPELFAAAKRTLEIRGDDGTGWSLAWKISCWARLHDGNHAALLLSKLITPERTYANMFDSCPPFQIDGNFGGTTGIAEMLLQSDNGQLNILPALPDGWPSGQVHGLCARGGYVVDMSWQGGRLDTLTIRPKFNGQCIVRYQGHTTTLATQAGKVYKLNDNLVVVSAT